MVEHSVSLKDGRILAYHTFPEFEEEHSLEESRESSTEASTGSSNRHPVLYLHGFPGCGLEAKVSCAAEIARRGGRVYAVDRPGMGRKSSPYPKGIGEIAGGGAFDEEGANDHAADENDGDDNLRTIVENIWELVEHLRWTAFSVVGVSGGGPYALALLASACRKNGTAKLVSVALVGAVCLSAGTSGMKEKLVQMIELIDRANNGKSAMAQWKLWATAKSMGPVYNYVIPFLPYSWIRKLVSYSNHDSAPADREWIDNNEDRLLDLLGTFPTMVAQGGAPGILDDATICMARRHFYEEVLARAYEGDALQRKRPLPNIGIFHGEDDRNVPISHARHLHANLFHERSELVEFAGMGHDSTIMEKSGDYAAFVCRANG